MHPRPLTLRDSERNYAMLLLIASYGLRGCEVGRGDLAGAAHLELVS
jgi:hypothetical protein